MTRKAIGTASGKRVHVEGALILLRLVEEDGRQTAIRGPAVSEVPWNGHN